MRSRVRHLLALAVMLTACMPLGHAQSEASTTVPAPAATAASTVPSRLASIVIDVHNGTKLMVGDSLSLTITYRWPAGWRVETPAGEPSPAQAFAKEFVTSMPPPEHVSTGEEERRVFTMTLTALHSGAWQLPQPTLSVTRDGQHVTATASEVLLQVGSDARPAQLPPPRAAWVQPAPAVLSASSPWLWWSAFALLVIVVVIIVRWRRRVPLVLPTPIENFARDWQAATSTADGKEAGARLSLALRRYVGALYTFDGPGSTTREMALQVRRRMPSQEQLELVRLLEQLDALRWSADELPASAIRPLASNAQSWTTAVQQRLDAAAAAAAREHRGDPPRLDAARATQPDANQQERP